jgi:hypothetical protein
MNIDQHLPGAGSWGIYLRLQQAINTQAVGGIALHL